MGLERIKSLDEKVSGQLNGLREKAAQMQNELQTKLGPDRVAQMQTQCRAQADELRQRKVMLENRAATLRRHVHFLQMKAEGKKTQLADSDINQSLEQLEAKIKQYEQGNHHVREFVESKMREADCSAEKEAVKNFTVEINKILLGSVKSMGSSIQSNVMGGGFGQMGASFGAVPGY